MAWTMPDDRQLGNIIYNATSGMREAGSRYRAAIRNSRIAQGIAIVNRARQEVGSAPGWGTGHGTEPAGVTSSADPAILAECRAAAQAALRRWSQLPVMGRAPDPAEVYSHELNLHGAQYYKHDFGPPGVRWAGNPNTHLVASFGPFQDVARCIEEHGRIPACRGYLGVYVNFRDLGRALACLRLGCAPRRVPAGAVRAQSIESARQLPWPTLMRHNPSLS